jgi:hypothetical protein
LLQRLQGIATGSHPESLNAGHDSNYFIHFNIANNFIVFIHLKWHTTFMKTSIIWKLVVIILYNDVLETKFPLASKTYLSCLQICQEISGHDLDPFTLSSL